MEKKREEYGFIYVFSSGRFETELSNQPLIPAAKCCPAICATYPSIVGDGVETKVIVAMSDLIVRWFSVLIPEKNWQVLIELFPI